MFTSFYVYEFTNLNIKFMEMFNLSQIKDIRCRGNEQENFTELFQNNFPKT